MTFPLHGKSQIRVPLSATSTHAFDCDMHKFRIAFVNTHPIQYFAPLYAYLNRTGEFAITALYLSDFSIRGSLDRAFGRRVTWDIDLLSGYDARFLRGAGRRNEPAGFFSIIAPEI